MGAQQTFPWGITMPDLKNAVGYVRISSTRRKGLHSAEAETQRNAIRELAKAKGIQIHRWAIDPTPERYHPDHQVEFSRICKKIQAWGYTTLLAASDAAVCSHPKFRAELYLIAARSNVVVISKESSSYDAFKAFVEERAMQNFLLRASGPSPSRWVVDKGAPAKEPEGYMVNVEGRIVEDTEQNRLFDRIRALRLQEIPIRDIVNRLAQEGFKNPQGKPWSIGKVAAISAKVAPGGTGRRRTSVQRAAESARLKHNKTTQQTSVLRKKGQCPGT